MRKYFIITLTLIITLSAALIAGAAASETLKPARIAMLADGDSPYYRNMADILKTELNILMQDERDLIFLDGTEWTGDWTPETARKMLLKALRDEQIDLVYCGGLLLANAALDYEGKLPKPVVSGFVEDDSAVNLPISADGKSTLANYTFAVVPGRAEDDIDMFRKIVPFNNLAVLADAYFIEHIPEIAEQAAEYTAASGIQIELVPMTDSATETLAAIPAAAQAVYLTPSVRMDEEETQALIDGITARKLPSFSMEGVEDVNRGVMAGARTEDETRIRRRLALNIERILAGVPPEQLPVQVDSPIRITLNAHTARQIGVHIPYRTMLTADIIHPEQLETGKHITMKQAFERALADNPAISGEREQLAQALEEINLARATLLPRLQANLQYTQIDANRADASLGMQPRRQFAGGLALTQMIFNDRAITAWRASKPAAQSREFELAALKLDVMDQVAQAYINLLSSRALLVIDMHNHNLIQRYLDLARSRERSGMAGPEEIYRWESQVAAARATVLDSFANLSTAQTLFNQALGAEQDALWSPADIDDLMIDNPYLTPEFSEAIENDREFAAFREFLLSQALRNAPELQALDAAIQAQDMMINQYRRRKIVPEVGVSLGYDRIFNRTLSSADDQLPFALPEPDDNEWTVALGASWSLFEGGAQIAEVRRARAEKRRLLELRRQTLQALTQRLYQALISLSSSEPNIALTRQAAELARKNLEVIQDKYARGAVAIVELLDARSDVFNQAQRATLAKYRFILDVFKAQRASTWYAEMQTPSEREAWIAELTRRLQANPEEIK